MPQLDPTSFSSQLFWLMVFFVVLYVMLARFLLPRVHSVIEFRARTIEGDIEQATTMQSEATRIREIYEKGLAETRARSKAIISETKARIASGSAAKQAEIDAIISQQVSASEAGIASAKEDVRKKMQPVAGELAENIVNIILRHKPDPKELASVMAGVTRGGVL